MPADRAGRRRWCLALGVATLVGAAALPASATFRDPPVARSSFGTAQLQPVGSVSAKGECYGGVLGLLLAGPGVTLTWTHSASTWRDGYEARVLPSGPWRSVSGSATRAEMDGLRAGTTYSFEVRTTRGAWRSPSRTVSASTPALCLLG